jgi:hypothetical protein
MKLIALTTIIFVLGVPILSRALALKQDPESSDVCNLSENGYAGRRAGPSPYGGPDTSADPVIFGEEFTVPELHMQFVHMKTGNSLVPTVIDVRYFWQWLEYPYADYPRGAWSDAEDWVKCMTGGDNQLVVPAYTVKPFGWYDGKYTKFPYTLTGSRKPRFDRLEIVINFDDRQPDRLIMRRNELRRYNDARATIRLFNDGYPQVEFEKRSN